MIGLWIAFTSVVLVTVVTVVTLFVWADLHVKQTRGAFRAQLKREEQKDDER